MPAIDPWIPPPDPPWALCPLSGGELFTKPLTELERGARYYCNGGNITKMHAGLQQARDQVEMQQYLAHRLEVAMERGIPVTMGEDNPEELERKHKVLQEANQQKQLYLEFLNDKLRIYRGILNKIASSMKEAVALHERDRRMLCWGNDMPKEIRFEEFLSNPCLEKYRCAVIEQREFIWRYHAQTFDSPEEENA